MSTMIVEVSATSVPLTLTIKKVGIGGLSGQSPTVAVRDGATIGSYLDFNDNVFKASGWVLKYGAMVESERGHYRRPLNVSLLGLPAGTILVAEYSVDDGGDVVGVAHDLVFLVAQGYDTALIRKAITNRQEELPGLPGKLILYDDDDATPILEQDLRDNSDGGIVSAVGVPAKRSKSLI